MSEIQNTRLRRNVNKKLLIVVIGAMAIGMLSYGVFVYPSVLSPRGHVDNLNFVDNVTIKVFNPNGTVAQVWQGHNNLEAGAINGIVGCITGASTTPAPYGSCSSWITGMAILISGSTTPISVTATSTPFANSPGTACTPSTGVTYCTGWTTTAFYGETTFNASNCPTTCTVNYAQAANGGGTYFDDILTNIAVAKGDSLSVTITFTIM